MNIFCPQRSHSTWLVAIIAIGLFTAPSLQSQEEGPSIPMLTVEKISVEPSSPGPDTLCKLRVSLRNAGSEIASQLDFRVSINGQELAVYRNQLFMFPIEPDQTAEIKLYNFWSTETSRSMPKDGKLKIEVSLVGAQWMKIESEDDVEVWKPLGPVDQLPVAGNLTLEMAKPSG
jgi:hypothetical protein